MPFLAKVGSDYCEFCGHHYQEHLTPNNKCPIEKEPTMNRPEDTMPPVRRSRARIKRVTYELKVTAVKPPEMNEQEYLNWIRAHVTPATVATNDVDRPKVSVMKRTEEFLP